MAYNNFTLDKLFQDEELNIICNLIYENLITSFSTTIANDNFCITGIVSKILQGEAVQPVKLIAFATDQDIVFNYCAKKLPIAINATGAVIFTNRVQIVHPKLFIEVWLLSPLNIVQVDNLRTQLKTEIPPNIN